MPDYALMRLQYEILNVPIEQLAVEATEGVENTLLVTKYREKIESFGWKQWWPEADLIVTQEDVDAAADGDDAMAQQAELFLERSKRRLSVYNVAKEIMLTQKYLALESALVDSATKLITGSTLEAKDVRALSALYKDLTAKSVTSALAAVSFGTDETGLPTVIMRDLSNT
jgi:hypothetical protein